MTSTPSETEQQNLTDDKSREKSSQVLQPARTSEWQLYH